MRISPIMSRCINARSGFLLAVLLVNGCSSPASNIPELTPERLVAEASVSGAARENLQDGSL